MTIEFVFFFKGNILRSEIDGCILMKNFVAGSPEVKIVLNDDFFVGKSDVVSRGNGKFITMHYHEASRNITSRTDGAKSQ